MSLLDLFAWSEATFLSRFEGSAIRRIGFERWSRNIAIALGNADHDPRIIDALNRRASSEHSALVREHIAWALREQAEKASQPNR